MQEDSTTCTIGIEIDGPLPPERIQETTRFAVERVIQDELSLPRTDSDLSVELIIDTFTNADGNTTPDAIYTQKYDIEIPSHSETTRQRQSLEKSIRDTIKHEVKRLGYNLYDPPQ